MISDLRFMKIADQHYSPMKLHSNFLKMNVLEIYQKMMILCIPNLGIGNETAKWGNRKN